ncbi:basic membrane protein A [Arcanobacterium wilhelmae]|uniref:Basic membrane protein A n=1 Tax=Arcanobacterium wilhelmae TaxID=1803177 RepID=A0ABT9NDL4_9ACTO|nr:basic membrane protein A [Arcanobacterium wilhelmae]
MKSKLTSLFAVAASATLLLGACGGASTDSKGGNTAGAGFKACLVSDAGGWDDHSFNESAFVGLKQAEKDLGVKINTAESKQSTDYQPNVEAMVSDGCNMVIGVGFNLNDAILKVAQTNKDLEFGLIDSVFTEGGKPVEVENGRPLLFNTHEAAYLAGYVSAGMSKTGKVATFGGIQIPSVTIFMDGFADGVKKYNEDSGKKVELLGWDKDAQKGAFTNSFDDQNKGKQQTQQFLDQGADVVMPVAGPVGLGAAAAVKAKAGAMFVGVDSDWFEAVPDYKDITLTSVKKEIAASVVDTVKQGVDKKFSKDPYVGDLKNGGVSLAPFHDFDSKVPEELKAKVKELEEKIKSGELKVESPAANK